MASVVISGDTSGTATLQAQAIAGNTVLTLPTTNGTLITTASGQTLTSPTITGAVMSSMASSVITSGTAQNTTSGTSIDFTGIPSWVKRITVLFSGVSTSGTSSVIVRIGAGSILTTGYLSSSWQGGSSDTGITYTNGFGIDAISASNYLRSGKLVLTNISGNTWIGDGVIARLPGVNDAVWALAGNVTLSGTLDRVSVTTSNGTDLFDAGSINILYE